MVTIVNPENYYQEHFLNGEHWPLSWGYCGKVESRTSTAPVFVSDGAVWLVPNSPTLPAWVGHEGEFAISIMHGGGFVTPHWYFMTPSKGMLVFIKDENIRTMFNGTLWLDEVEIFTEDTFYTATFTGTSPKTFDHNLGAKPIVRVIDDDNRMFFCNITHNSANQIQLDYQGSITGRVMCFKGAAVHRYQEVLATPSSPATINHNIGAYPHIDVIDLSTDEKIWTRITHTDGNNAQLHFTGSFASLLVICALSIGEGHQRCRYLSTTECEVCHPFFSYPVVTLMEKDAPRIRGFIGNKYDILDAVRIEHNNAVDVCLALDYGA
jgi:hypothetical protein